MRRWLRGRRPGSSSTLPWCCRYSGGKEVLVIRGGGPLLLLLVWLK